MTNTDPTTADDTPDLARLAQALEWASDRSGDPGSWAHMWAPPDDVTDVTPRSS